MTKRNPKQVGSDLFDCIPQTGPCPNNCSQCFYNWPGAFYVDINEPHIPTPEEVGNGIVRMNCGHDSNMQRELVIETAKQYKNFFFNTSIPNFDFPGPIVFTANPKEEGFICPTVIDDCWKTGDFRADNLMFVRLRVSASNLARIFQAIKVWTDHQIPVILTFMAYYDQEPPGTELVNAAGEPAYLLEDKSEFTAIAYVWKQRHINSYFCATEEFMRYVTKKMKKIGGRLVTRCGTVGSNWCRDCKNCETYYWQTIKHLLEKT